MEKLRRTRSPQQKEAKRLMNLLIKKIYRTHEDVPVTQTEAFENVRDFAMITELIHRVLVRRDTPE